ncbi:hypothetical protein PG987_015470 [Apiospora arundinis]
MLGFKIVFFAVMAMLTACVIAETGKFNIASKYKVTKNGKTEEQRNTILYTKDGIKSLDAYVKHLHDWSGGEFNCKKSRHGSLYNVEATKVYDNKDGSVAANNRAKSVINENVNKE